MLIDQMEEVTGMDREQARKLISGLLNRYVDSVSTDELESTRSEVEAQIRAGHMKGVYRKIADALDTELAFRKSVEHIPHISPQTQAETIVAGAPGDSPGELRHGVARDASNEWRVTGR